MKKIHNRTFLCSLLCLLFFGGMLYFLAQYALHADEWANHTYNRQLYTDSGTLVCGQIFDRNGSLLSAYQDQARVYHDDPILRTATLHAVGDPFGKIGTSAMSVFSEYLTAYSLVSGNYRPEGAENALYLTLDAQANKIAYEAMDGKHGTVAVYNYKTGELLCMVSSPAYDPMQIPEDLETNPAYDGVYMNRLFSSAFPPGSVMKTVTLQAALETLPDIENRTFSCNGRLTVGDNKITCPTPHGTLTLQEALAVSCNCTFAALTVEMGAEIMSEYVKKAGLTSGYLVNSVSTAKGSFSLLAASEYQLGWAGVGLYHDLVNPCGVLIYMGAIANGGKAAIPTLFLQAKTAAGKETSAPSPTFSGELLRPETAQTVREYLIRNVPLSYDPSRFPGMTIGAKSGTIERIDGLSDCWFAGFLADEETPYAFVVYLEHGGSGNRVAGAVAAEVLSFLTENTQPQ